jgi:hypothetical protein
MSIVKFFNENLKTPPSVYKILNLINTFSQNKVTVQGNIIVNNTSSKLVHKFYNGLLNLSSLNDLNNINFINLFREKLSYFDLKTMSLIVRPSLDLITLPLYEFKFTREDLILYHKNKLLTAIENIIKNVPDELKTDVLNSLLKDNNLKENFILIDSPITVLETVAPPVTTKLLPPPTNNLALVPYEEKVT